jgi:hypothetical protein
MNQEMDYQLYLLLIGIVRHLLMYSNQSPIPKLGALLLTASGTVYCRSVTGRLTCGNLGPLPKENFCFEVEKFVTSNYVTIPPCFVLIIDDILLSELIFLICN